MGSHLDQTVAPVRKTVIGREDVAREPFRPGKRWTAPRWLRRLTGALLALFVLPWLLGALLEETQKPTSLGTSVMTGPRLATGPVASRKRWTCRRR